MKQKNLFLLCGTPGAGKSTWIRNQNSKTLGNHVTVSRDAIRFEMLKDGEDYFAHETEVFNTFCAKIQEAIDSDEIDSVFADATHLNEKSRNKTLDKLSLENVNIYPVDFNLPVEICLAQNENRKDDGRAYVPRSVIRRMNSQYVPPRDGEKYEYTRVIHIGGEAE